MQVNEVFSALVAKTGLSARALSLKLGRAETWARNSAGRDTKLSTIVTVAEVAGCEVVIMDKATGERVGSIEPPRP